MNRVSGDVSKRNEKRANVRSTLIDIAASFRQHGACRHRSQARLYSTKSIRVVSDKLRTSSRPARLNRSFVFPLRYLSARKQTANKNPFVIHPPALFHSRVAVAWPFRIILLLKFRRGPLLLDCFSIFKRNDGSTVRINGSGNSSPNESDVVTISQWTSVHRDPLESSLDRSIKSTPRIEFAQKQGRKDIAGDRDRL